MGWLLKQPQVSESIQLYTVSEQRTILLIGLGNVGTSYRNTRHNVGFICIDAFVATHEEMSPWQLKRDLKAEISTGRLGDALVVAVKPTTLMNRSGQAVQATRHFYRVSEERMVVIHDELDIPFGQIRLRMGGSSAGHNGIKSVTEAVGEAYGRIRIGIGPKSPASIDSANFVLQKFSVKQQQELPNLTREVNTILTEYIYGGQLPHETRSFLID